MEESAMEETRHLEAEAEAHEGGLSRLQSLLILLAIAIGFGAAYVRSVGVRHQFFQLSNQSSVETWSLRLPRQYRLEYWRYKPANPAGGIRLLGPGGGSV
jgi:hypothetical protein